MSRDRISLLSSDYDGTLSPFEVTREESRVPPDLDVVLRGIAEKAKLAIVTSKSFDFISSRIPYAQAWGCSGGLDVRFKDGREFAASPPIDVGAELRKTKRMLGEQVSYEEKRSSTLLLGFSVDWRGRPAPTGLSRAIAALQRDGLFVAHEPQNPFVDFFGSRPDKGRAVSRIKEVLGATGSGTIFMGDSSTDNPAFWEVGIPVGVDHGQPLGSLECDFVVTQRDVTPFLSALYQRDMVFDPGLPGLHRRGV